MKKLITAFVLLFVGAAFGQEALHCPSPQQVSDIREKLSGFTCPEGASTTACKSFSEMVSSGDPALLVSFLPLTGPNDRCVASVFVIFDDEDSDGFRVVSTFGHKQNNVLKFDIFYSMFQKGINRTATTETVPFVKGKILKMNKDGVVIILDGYALTAGETYTAINEKVMNVESTVNLSTLRTETIWRSDGQVQHVSNTKAFKVLNF